MSWLKLEINKLENLIEVDLEPLKFTNQSSMTEEENSASNYNECTRLLTSPPRETVDTIAYIYIF